MEEPDIEILIKKEMGRRRPRVAVALSLLRRARTSTWSVNPYLQKRYHEYTMDIRPKAIMKQLFAIREQISGELINDLRELPRKQRTQRRGLCMMKTGRPSTSRGWATRTGVARRPHAATRLALQLCTAFAVESILSNVDDRTGADVARAPGSVPQHSSRARDAPLSRTPSSLTWSSRRGRPPTAAFEESPARGADPPLRHRGSGPTRRSPGRHCLERWVLKYSRDGTLAVAAGHKHRRPFAWASS